MGLYETEEIPTTPSGKVFIKGSREGRPRPRLTPEEQALADKRKEQKGTGKVEKREGSTSYRM